MLYLTENDRDKIVEGLAAVMAQRANDKTVGDPRGIIDGSPEVYVFKGVVPRRSMKCNVDGTLRWLPGQAVLPIWKIAWDDTCGWHLIELKYKDDSQKTETIHNVTGKDTPNDYNICWRTKFGRWVALPVGEPSSSSSGSYGSSSGVSTSGSASSVSSVSSSGSSASSSGSSVSGSVSASASGSGVSSDSSASSSSSAGPVCGDPILVGGPISKSGGNIVQDVIKITLVDGQLCQQVIDTVSIACCDGGSGSSSASGASGSQTSTEEGSL